LAKHSASRSNFDYVKSLGASAVFDYHDSNVVSNILAATKEADVNIKRVFGSISENGSLKLASDVLVSGGMGGKLVIVLHWPADDPTAEWVDVSLTVAMRSGQDQSELGAWVFNEREA